MLTDATTTPIASAQIEEPVVQVKLTAAEAKAVTESAKLSLYDFEVNRVYNRIESESASAGDTVDSVFHRNMPEESIAQLIAVLEVDGYKVIKQKDAKAIKVSW